MSALTADRNTPFKEPSQLPFLVAAGAKIFAGAIVVANAAGYAKQGATAATLTYLGRADEYVDNTAGADGALTVRVRRNAAFKWLNSGSDPVVQADIGKVCFIVDDQTVAATSNTAARSAAGIVVGIDTDGVWVE